MLPFRLVHFNVQGRGDVACGASRSGLAMTDDHEKVTCERCKLEIRKADYNAHVERVLRASTDGPVNLTPLLAEQASIIVEDQRLRRSYIDESAEEWT